MFKLARYCGIVFAIIQIKYSYFTIFPYRIIIFVNNVLICSFIVYCNIVYVTVMFREHGCYSHLLNSIVWFHTLSGFLG
jgi:hypothetical protein